jgi:nitroreductase/SAM-dependent methyltransferase
VPESHSRQDAAPALRPAAQAHAREILDLLATRRSCRDFDGSEIDQATLRAIVADGTEAPSSCNQQNWHFIVVTDPARKRRAREISGGNHHFEFCSALIYLCFQKGWTHGNFSIVQSVAAACYHMMLSAHLRGFDGIWNAGIGDNAQVREMLDLPPTFDVVGALAIGRAKPDAPTMKAPRRAVDDIVSFERFTRPETSVYPAQPAPSYPYFDIRNDHNPFAVWDPRQWTWGQIADFRGLSVWAKSPLAGVYVSRRQGEAQAVEHELLPDPLTGKIVEVMPWGGTSTVALCNLLAQGAQLRVAELSDGNISFIRERLQREGLASASVGFDLMENGVLPYGDGTVDTVVLPQVLEHMPAPEAVLDEVRRVLRPGGCLVVSVRNINSAYGALWQDTESKAQIPNQGPFTPLPAAQVRGWLQDRFAIEDEIGIGREPAADAERLAGTEAGKGRLYAVRVRRE